MKRTTTKHATGRKLAVRKESLRQLDAETLVQVGGGYVLPAYLKTCMGTWYTVGCP